jgi:signal transduction histidine kinase
MKIQPGEADLNEMVTRAIADSGKTGDPALVVDLRPMSKVAFDREQMLKVVTNLVLNASEAIAEGGQVRIATDQRAGWAVISVTDNGCGMSPEFISRSLFRPFQTTKKNGLGIGMFQSKTIVEAHGGRITVTSEPGKGTTFEVFLPAAHG